ncbi:hypothetical protein GCM10029964_021790 [Kibdelosporangium lantanae]
MFVDRCGRHGRQVGRGVAGVADDQVRGHRGAERGRGRRAVLLRPGLGLWRARTSANGDIVVGEDQLRAVAAASRGNESFAHKVDEMLGASWDEALEPFRRAGDGAPVTWLHRVG